MFKKLENLQQIVMSVECNTLEDAFINIGIKEQEKLESVVFEQK